MVINQDIFFYAYKTFLFLWSTRIGMLTASNVWTAVKLSTSAFRNKLCPDSTIVLFFPDLSYPCKWYLNDKPCPNKSCKFLHKPSSLGYLMNCLNQTIFSIDVCIFVITSQDLSEILIKLHKKGVIVRIITDYEKMDLNNSQIEQFRANGIQVRHDKTSFLMHHKFAIIDGKTLINGSFNWTNQAITGNQENLIITNNQLLIKPFKDQFEKLWIMYKP
ncbi:uncharacterized protein LOC100209424 [Hydra vulgaris]|nr:mitochondrial cardiolipin hydrolase [Hydra vulgaris]